MNDLLHNLIEALREELKQYGEMLAVLDQQQNTVVQRQVNDLLQNVAGINAQADVIAAVRREREQHQRNVARLLGLPDDASFAVITPCLPADYRPLVSALVEENNELLARVHHRTQQNHLLLSHAVELMQQLMTAIFPGGSPPKTYDNKGRLPVNPLPQQSFYESVG
jgi:flagellar biosynthesis/type III secretory pathway chaperone